VRLETTAPTIKRGAAANVVPEMKYAFFAHANAICALRNDPIFDLAQSNRTEIFLVLASGKMFWALEGADNVTRRS
jgi:hypothetical protein